MVSLFVCPLTASGAPAQGDLLGEPFEHERFHLRFRPPAGWRLVNQSAFGNEPIEFWKSSEYGPRIQITAFPYELQDPSNLDLVQQELAAALTRQFPSLTIVQEKQLDHRGSPAVEVLATLAIDNTYYHVIQRCLFARGRIYIITGASFESTFLDELPTFRASLDSVEILGLIFDPASGRARTGHLIQPRTAAGLFVASFVAALLMRRISTRRLRRMTP